MRLPLATDLKTRTGAPDKDARIKNAYVETKGDQSVVRKRPIARGGVSIVAGVAQGGIAISVDGVQKVVTFFGDTQTTSTDSAGTTWSAGTDYSAGDHTTSGWQDYWAVDDNVGNNPTTSPTHWSTTYQPAIPIPPFVLQSWVLRAATSSTIADATYGNGKFVSSPGDSTVGNNPMYSADGITWSAGSASLVAGFYQGIAYGGGVYVITGNSTNGARSTDGINWSNITLSESFGTLNFVQYGAGVFVAGGDGGAVKLCYSSNGTSWTSTITCNCRRVRYVNGYFVAINSADQFFTSTDGINWSNAYAMPNSGLNFWTDVTYWNGNYVFVCSNSTYAMATTFADIAIAAVLSTSGIGGYATAINYKSQLIAFGNGPSSIYDVAGDFWYDMTYDTIPGNSTLYYALASNGNRMISASGTKIYTYN